MNSPFDSKKKVVHSKFQQQPLYEMNVSSLNLPLVRVEARTLGCRKFVVVRDISESSATMYYMHEACLRCRRYYLSDIYPKMFYFFLGIFEF